MNTSQFSRFLTVGVFNTLLGYAVIFVAMYGFGISPEMSNVLGFSVGLVSSFLLSRKFTFRSEGKANAELIRFLIVFLFAYLLNLAILHLLVRYLDAHAGWSQIIAGAAYTICAYWLNARWVFSLTTALKKAQ